VTLATLFAFAAAFAVFAASPGPDNVTIVARTLGRGPLAGVAYGAGTTVGILVFLVLAAAGLSALVAENAELAAWLRYAGAAVLVWFGIRLWLADPVPPEAAPAPTRGDLLGTFASGLALNLGNPKMPVFYLAILPNVFAAGPPSAADVGLLALVVVAVEVAVVGGHVLAAQRARRLLRRPGALRLLNRGAGGVMVGAGVAVAAR
jgi:threonine/homoserine/homoserine lactone efflux protein